ncbi:MAG TPA: NADP-dependent oxidoreductase [Gaiellaceae bacterium]|nr:NADP-dependent oxidoreductase [Gaiellaceae bacterium]
MSREVILAARPQGVPQESDFELRDVADDPELADGEVLVRNVFVSVDPYMRGRMSGTRTYVGPYEVGEPIDGGSVGRVVASKHDGLAEGDWVLSQLGWREAGVVAGRRVRKLDPALAAPSTALGALGMPGFTAWLGLTEIAEVKEGETIYVSGAAGAVGSAATQMAKLKGLRVIGSAGSGEKVEWLRSLGVEAFNYRETRAKDALADGIDVYFDNVGGEQLEAALSALRPFGRVAACGAISRYNDQQPEPGPRNIGFVVTKRLRIQGFIVRDHDARFGDFLREVGPWVADGKIECRETMIDGIENLPAAFAGLFRGDNTGKMLVRVGPESTS